MTVFIHDLAFVTGDVHLGDKVSVWPFAVIRADTDRVEIGDETNVQDHCVIHVDAGVPVSIGARCALGHRAIVHGATIEDDCLIGMGAIVLNRARIGRGSIVAAGAVVREGQEVPPGSLVAGVPARVLRLTTPDERERIARTVASYVALQGRHAAGEFPRREYPRDGGASRS